MSSPRRLSVDSGYFSRNASLLNVSRESADTTSSNEMSVATARTPPSRMPWGTAMTSWHQNFLAPLLRSRASIESKRTTSEIEKSRKPEDELVMVLTDESQLPSTEFPGMAQQFCKDLHRAEYQIDGRPIDSHNLPKHLDDRLEAAQTRLKSLCDGDDKLAFLATAVANQSLLSLVLDGIQSGRLLVEQVSGRNITTLDGCHLIAEIGGKSPQFNISRADDGGVVVEGSLNFKRITNLMVGEDDDMEMFEVDPRKSGGTASIVVHIGPGPDYAATVKGMTSNLLVTVPTPPTR